MSDWSKAKFEALFGCDFRFLETISLYVRTEMSSGPQEPFAIDRPFFLTVGGLETRKNQIAALEAYRSGGFNTQGIKYILCGPRGEATSKS